MRRLPLLLGLLLLLTGCGDLSSSTGELGRMNYRLHSDFLVDGSELADTSVLTAHPQLIALDLTDEGEQQGENRNFEELTHTSTPAEGVTIEAFNPDDDRPGNFTITVEAPGDYVIESFLEGDLFERITLTFDAPATLDLVTWVRPPNADDFDEATGSPVFVVEGTQAAFVPIPVDAAGDRIAGDFVPEMTADPDWAVVKGMSILGIYEQNVVVARSPASVYFIEPGTITVTLTDTENGVAADAQFEVDPVNAPVGR